MLVDVIRRANWTLVQSELKIRSPFWTPFAPLERRSPAPSTTTREIVEAFTNPYFILDDRMTRALTEAPKRGVRVVLLLPGAIDNNLVRQASRSRIGEMFGSGIEIHE